MSKVAKYQMGRLGRPLPTFRYQRRGLMPLLAYWSLLGKRKSALCSNNLGVCKVLEGSCIQFWMKAEAPRVSKTQDKTITVCREGKSALLCPAAVLTRYHGGDNRIWQERCVHWDSKPKGPRRGPQTTSVA